MGIRDRIRDGFKKTRDRMAQQWDILFGGANAMDDDFYEELETILVTADVGVQAAVAIADTVRREAKERQIRLAGEGRRLVYETLRDMMRQPEPGPLGTPAVILVAGVNGSGKTTTTGKLAAMYHRQGRSVILAAADTFRAAAQEQLRIWGERAEARVISGAEGADPASVVYDAIQAAKAAKADLLICDTAGRLHNKKNLMDELSKIHRVIDREYSEAQKHVWLVLDGTSGQNALIQVREFSQAIGVTGVIMTKLDGTAKGGILTALKQESSLPILYIGVGEQMEDLVPYDGDAYVEALLGESFTSQY
jgi:fused signal recognition particle receptor